MQGDIDNTQPVCLDGAPSVKARVIYSVRRVSGQRIQFGTVKVDYRMVAVWRPFDPDDPGHNAAWRSVPWQNVYRIYLPQHSISASPRYIEYTVDEVEIGGVCAKLPLAQLELSSRLKEHLEQS